MNITFLARSYYRSLPTFTQAAINYINERDDLGKVLVRKGGLYNFKNNSQIDLRYINKTLNILLNNFVDFNDSYNDKYFDDYLLDIFASFNLSKTDVLYSEVIQSPRTYIKARKKGIKTVLYPGVLHYSWYYKTLVKESKKFEKYKFKDKYFETWRNKPKKIIETNKCLKLVDHLIVASKLQMQINVSEGIPEEKMTILPLGVDTSYYSPPIIKNNDKFRVLFVGHGCLSRGVYYLVEAWRRLELNDSELIIIGLMGEEFENHFRELKNVKFLRNVPPEKVLKYYHKSSILVHPPIAGSGARSVLEALCCGLPVILTENEGYKDLITNNKEGFIIANRCIDSIMSKIRFFYDNPNELLRMSKNAEVTGSQYSFENYGKSLHNTIRKLANDR